MVTWPVLVAVKTQMEVWVWVVAVGRIGGWVGVVVVCVWAVAVRGGVLVGVVWVKAEV